MSTYYVKRGKTSPAAEAQLLNGDGTPADLTDATSVTFLVRSAAIAGAAMIAGAATILSPPTDGKVSYQWVTQDTTVAGEFPAEWEVLWSNGRKTAFPDGDYDLVVILEDLR